MLKAIWPSLRIRVPNHLPESANITTLGRSPGPTHFQSLSRSTEASQNRYYVLLHLLGNPTPFHARFSAEDPVAVHRQGPHCPTLLDRLAHLGVRESPCLRRSFRFACHRDGERLLLVVFNSIERVAWVLCHLGCQHPRFYGTASQIFRSH